jgi:SAM-dependent methyltransferase
MSSNSQSLYEGSQLMTIHQRSAEQIREHYEIEKQLARRLFDSTPQARKTLYTVVYDELFQKVPHHPQLDTKASPEYQATKVARELRRLRGFLHKDSQFMEIGPGDCALSRAVAPLVKRVYAIDVSNEITKGLNLPPNFELILSDGSSVPVPPESIDVAYSNQLMEHLHPDDAFEQLQNIYKALAPKGIYLCITPNRLSGPHDVSRYFDAVATGFHLREYTVTDLSDLFKAVGFRRTQVYICVKGRRIFLPTRPIKWMEATLDRLPYSIRKKVASLFPFNLLLGITLVGSK